MAVLDALGRALLDALLMAYQVWWALVFGFLVSAVVQAWVPRRRVESLLAGEGVRQLGAATGLGAASSSCSYAAVAIARALFAKGASLRSALAFQFASTNLVWELGLVIWVLLGWRFTVGELAGGLVMIGLMWAGTRLFVSPRLEARARERAGQVQHDHQHHVSQSSGGWRQRLRSQDAWADVALNFRGDWQMLYKEVGLGFLLAGFVGLLGNGFFHALFLTGAPEPWRSLENAVVGPLVAVLSFVCSVGNVPLAAVLWSGGISFAGVLAFLFADLVVVPLLLIYRKYYGGAFAARIALLQLAAMSVAALLLAGLAALAGLTPQSHPARSDVFGGVHLDYKLVLDVVATLAFLALFALTLRRGAVDPVCGMAVDRQKASSADWQGRRYFFCSAHCRERFLAEPGAFAAGGGGEGHTSEHHAH